MPAYYHGGIGGLRVGDRLVPSPPHVQDGCPICEARAAGRVCRVGEYRRWLRLQGPDANRVLAMLEEADDADPIDPPSQRGAVYVTESLDYAAFYAARSQGDLYQVKPEGVVTPSTEDHFPSGTVASARVVAVVRRNVRLTRTERRRILARWKKADRRAARKASV